MRFFNKESHVCHQQKTPIENFHPNDELHRTRQGESAVELDFDRIINNEVLDEKIFDTCHKCFLKVKINSSPGDHACHIGFDRLNSVSQRLIYTVTRISAVRAFAAHLLLIHLLLNKVLTMS